MSSRIHFAEPFSVSEILHDVYRAEQGEEQYGDEDSCFLQHGEKRDDHACDPHTACNEEKRFYRTKPHRSREQRPSPCAGHREGERNKKHEPHFLVLLYQISVFSRPSVERPEKAPKNRPVLEETANRIEQKEHGKHGNEIEAHGHRVDEERIEFEERNPHRNAAPELEDWDR